MTTVSSGHRQEERPLDFALQERPDHPDRLAAMVERGGEPLPLGPQIPGQALDLGPGRHEHGHPAPFLHHVADVPLVEELVGGLRQHLHPRLERRVERVGEEDLGAFQVAGVERRIHRGAEPDEAAPRPLPQRQAELQLRRGLMDLVDDQGIPAGDQVVLEPAPGDPGGHDHHVPGRSLGGRLPLPIHHADPERLLQDRLGDGTDAERLARPGARHDSEPAGRGGQVADLLSVLPLEERVEVETERELVAVGVGIGRKVMVAGRAHDESYPCAPIPQNPGCRLNSQSQFLPGRSNGWTRFTSATA